MMLFFSIITNDKQPTLGIAQFKFVAVMGSAMLKQALRTTDYDSAFVGREDQITNIKKRQKIEEFKPVFKPQQRLLRILFTFPFEPNDEDLPDVVQGNHVYMVLTKSKSREIFTETEWLFLERVKKSLGDLLT